MPTTSENLNLADAKQIIEAGVAKATAIGVACTVAVVDAGGYLVGLVRQDGAMTGSVELAVNKAYSACVFNNTTEVIGQLAQPGADLFGIQHSHAGRIVVFGGGIPIRYKGGIIGAVGVSGGSVEQDIEIADAAQAAVSCMNSIHHD